MGALRLMMRVLDAVDKCAEDSCGNLKSPGRRYCDQHKCKNELCKVLSLLSRSVRVSMIGHLNLTKQARALDKPVVDTVSSTHAK